MKEKVKTSLKVAGVVALVVLDIALQWFHHVQCAQIYGYEPSILRFLGLPIL